MKERNTLSRLVAIHPFLSGVKPSIRRLFCQCATLQRFSEGQILFSEGSPAERFYLINSGQVLLEVAVPDREMLTIEAVGAGQALGWSWFFPPFQWRFTATAVQPTETIVFAAKALREQAELHQKFCHELVVRLGDVLAGRLEDVRTRLIYASQQRVAS